MVAVKLSLLPARYDLLAKGFSMRTPAMVCPAFKSFDRIRSAPAFAAAATINASQKHEDHVSGILAALKRAGGRDRHRFTLPNHKFKTSQRNPTQLLVWADAAQRRQSFVAVPPGIA